MRTLSAPSSPSTDLSPVSRRVVTSPATAVASGLQAVLRQEEQEAKVERFRREAREEVAELVQELDQDRWLLWHELERARGNGSPGRNSSSQGTTSGVELIRQPSFPAFSAGDFGESVNPVYATDGRVDNSMASGYRSPPMAGDWQIRPEVCRMSHADRQRALIERGPCATVLSAPRRIKLL